MGFVTGTSYIDLSQVVLVDSTIVKASVTNNKDLFWALKGGGPNFGKCTYSVPIDMSGLGLWKLNEP